MASDVKRVLAKFQSLIGRLKTAFDVPFGVPVSMFQSLIGRLKTGVALSSVAPCVRFQSLIGRLKTIQLPVAIPLGICVSIPHR